MGWPEIGATNMRERPGHHPSDPAPSRRPAAPRRWHGPRPVSGPPRGRVRPSRLVGDRARSGSGPVRRWVRLHPLASWASVPVEGEPGSRRGTAGAPPGPPPGRSLCHRWWPLPPASRRRTRRSCHLRVPVGRRPRHPAPGAGRGRTGARATGGEPPTGRREGAGAASPAPGPGRGRPRRPCHSRVAVSGGRGRVQCPPRQVPDPRAGDGQASGPPAGSRGTAGGGGVGGVVSWTLTHICGANLRPTQRSSSVGAVNVRSRAPPRRPRPRTHNETGRAPRPTPRSRAPRTAPPAPRTSYTSRIAVQLAKR